MKLGRSKNKNLQKTEINKNILYTVKPVYNGHPWDLKKAAV